jgi:hypothetical protein
MSFLQEQLFQFQAFQKGTIVPAFRTEQRMNYIELLLTRGVLNYYEDKKAQREADERAAFDPCKDTKEQNRLRVANGQELVAVCEHCQGKMRFLPDDTGNNVGCIHCGCIVHLWRWEDRPEPKVPMVAHCHRCQKVWLHEGVKAEVGSRTECPDCKSKGIHGSFLELTLSSRDEHEQIRTAFAKEYWPRQQRLAEKRAAIKRGLQGWAVILALILTPAVVFVPSLHFLGIIFLKLLAVYGVCLALFVVLDWRSLFEGQDGKLWSFRQVLLNALFLWLVFIVIGTIILLTGGEITWLKFN